MANGKVKARIRSASVEHLLCAKWCISCERRAWNALQNSLLDELITGRLGQVMNGKLKLVLKLPKSLQQDKGAPSAGTQSLKKRKSSEEAGNSQNQRQASSQTGLKREDGHSGGPGPAKKPKLVLHGPGSRPSKDAADGRPPDQPPVKQRLSIK